LSTRPVDQSIAAVPEDGPAREQRRRAVLSGGYRLPGGGEVPMVTLVGTGAVMPEVVAARAALEGDGVTCDVVCLTSADLVFRAVQARRGVADASTDVLETCFPVERAAPIVAVADGHPHTLSFLAAVNSAPVTSLGVSDFGQAGDLEDLYRHFGIDVPTIIGAAWDLIDERASTAGSTRATARGGPGSNGDRRESRK
jgi:pyruvate dehydrogenase E1 component